MRVEFAKTPRIDSRAARRGGRAVRRWHHGGGRAASIGADGIHSRTRASVIPDAPRPAYTGIINLGGVVQTDLPPTGDAMHMVFGRRAFFGYAVRPSGETYWFSNYAQKEEPARDAFTDVHADTMRDRLLALAPRRSAGSEPHSADALSGSIGAYPIYDMPPLPSWQRGAVCLIGDAAHAIGPHVGQGVSLALEDAFMVASCLRDFHDPAAAFTAFERLRRGRVEPVVRQSRRTGRQKAPAGWIGRKIRDFVLPMFLRQGADAAARELYGYELPKWDTP